MRPRRQKNGSFLKSVNIANTVKNGPWEGLVSLGQGAESPKLNTRRKMIFSDFLIIFDIAFFDVQIEARAKNIVNTVKK